MLTYWPYIAAFLSPVLGFLSAYVVIRINRRYADGQKLSEGETTWRAARLAAEAALGERISTETQARTHWQLENAGDLERVVEILKEFGEVQRLLAVIAATSQHHATEIAQLNRRLDATAQHLNDFILRHVKQPA